MCQCAAKMVAEGHRHPPIPPFLHWPPTALACTLGMPRTSLPSLPDPGAPQRIPNVKQRHAPLLTGALALAIATSLLTLSACKKSPTHEANTPGATASKAPEG